MIADKDVTRRLLVVEDDVEVRDILLDVVSDLGIEVVEAEDGAVGLSALKTQSFDAVLSDIRMPEISGLELFANALSENITTPFVFITGNDDIQTLLQAVRLGAIDFIQKPFDNNEVLDVISRAIEVGARRNNIMSELREQAPDVYDKLFRENKITSLMRVYNNSRRS